jgi:hypothetical protein
MVWMIVPAASTIGLIGLLLWFRTWDSTGLLSRALLDTYLQEGDEILSFVSHMNKAVLEGFCFCLTTEKGFISEAKMVYYLLQQRFRTSRWAYHRWKRSLDDILRFAVAFNRLGQVKVKTDPARYDFPDSHTAPVPEQDEALSLDNLRVEVSELLQGLGSVTVRPLRNSMENEEMA